jgi:DNA helicase-2/ATP-dependent DNA helicase PcrA
MSVAALIQELLTELNYADHLQKTQTEWESRWENVRELITFATEASTVDTKGVAPTVESQATATDTELAVQPAIVNEAESDPHFDDTDSPPEDESAMIEELEA